MQLLKIQGECRLLEMPRVQQVCWQIRRKALRPSSAATFGVSTWMATRDWLVRASQKRLWPCMVITCRICALGLATVGLLERLAGVWVSLLGVRRRQTLQCAGHRLRAPRNGLHWRHCYTVYVSLMRWFRSSRLYTLAVLGTLAAVNLCAGYAPFVSCEPSCRHK